MKKNRLAQGVLLLYLCVCACLMLFPVFYTVTSSFMGRQEILYYYGNITKGTSSAFLHLLPDRLSLSAYYEILLAQPNYLIKFWNSLLMTFCIIVGQLVVCVPAAYALAKFQLKHKTFYVYLVIVLMMMPLQISLVTNYWVLDKLNLIGSYLAIILPNIFSPFSLFLLYRGFCNVDQSVIEAAKLDGASDFMVLLQIAVPNAKNAICATVLMAYVSAWNMVEQPLLFLDNPAQYPLSIFLAQAGTGNLQTGFSSGVLAMVPGILLFLFFSDEFVSGLTSAVVVKR